MESASLALARPWLGRCVTVRIDRPLGSRHPKWGFLYPVNYGYVPGVIAPDGEELDAYVLGLKESLGVEEPVVEFTGRCIAIVHRLDDDDDKLVVVPQGITLTDDEICAQTRFQEQFFESRIVRAEQEG
jgi:inorganic pyrophosphatase